MPLRLRPPLRPCGNSACYVFIELEELGVALRIAQLVEQEVDGIHRAHRVQNPPQNVHFLEDRRIGEELLLARAGPRDVDRRECALVGNLAVKDQFRVAGALELFEDHFIHSATGID